MMGAFKMFNRGRFHVHMLPTTQFRTRHVMVKFCREPGRDEVTDAALVPYLWTNGTSRLPSPLALARYTDELFGAALRTGTGKRGNRQVAEVYATAPEETRLASAKGVFDDVLSLALEVVTHPLKGKDGFAEETVLRERSLQKKRIASLADDKMSYSMDECLRYVCEDRPEGFPRLGYESELDNVTPTSLWREHEKILNESTVHVYLIGAFPDPDKVANQLLDQLEGNLPGRQSVTNGTVLAVPINQSRKEPQVIIERQDIQQGKLNLGFRTGVSCKDDDYIALLVANGILGGFAHSKLFMNVREKASLAYYAYSRLDGLTGLAVISTGIEPQVYDQAKTIILEQIAALQKGDVTKDELELTQKALRNQYIQVLDQPVSRAEIHFTGALAGIERDVVDLMEDVQRVTIDQVVEASQKFALDTVYFLRNQEGETDAK